MSKSSEDLKLLRDFLESIRTGWLWSKHFQPVTAFGKKCFAEAVIFRREFYYIWGENIARKARLAYLVKEVDSQRAANEILTDTVERLEREKSELKDKLRTTQLRLLELDRKLRGGKPTTHEDLSKLSALHSMRLSGTSPEVLQQLAEERGVADLWVNPDLKE